MLLEFMQEQARDRTWHGICTYPISRNLRADAAVLWIWWKSHCCVLQRRRQSSLFVRDLRLGLLRSEAVCNKSALNQDVQIRMKNQKPKLNRHK